MNRKNLLNLFLVLLLTSFISSCSWFGLGDDESKNNIQDENLDKSDEAIYAEAKSLMQQNYYSSAAETFSEIERLYPFSPLANKAKVMTAYAYYKDEEYEQAIDVIDNFINFNPGNEEVMFMYYLKAISYYDRIADIKRDQSITERAEESFKELALRFPDSKYSRDAKYKLDLIRDHLAGKEMEIGRYYLRTNKPLAAINRFQEVIKKYDNTMQAEEALYRLVETNLLLGLDGEAVEYGAVLGHNYPNGKWYKRAYELLKDGKDASEDSMLDFIAGSLSFSSDEDVEEAKKAADAKTEELMEEEVESSWWW